MRTVTAVAGDTREAGRSHSNGRLAAVVALVLAALFAVAGCSSTTATAPAGQGTAAGSAAYADLAPAEASSRLRTMTVSELPPEGVQTLERIVAGGPFPYGKDGATFGNREGRLPSREYGYYREYTVKTPGESDRGARRIVTGGNGAVFYTADHYDSFREVIAG